MLQYVAHNIFMAQTKCKHKKELVLVLQSIHPIYERNTKRKGKHVSHPIP